MKVVTYKWALVHWTCLDSWSTEQNPKSMLDRRLRIAMALCHLTSIVLLNLNVYLLDSSRALLFAPMLSEVWSSTDHNIIIYTGISVQTDISVDWMLGGGESWNCLKFDSSVRSSLPMVRVQFGRHGNKPSSSDASHCLKWMGFIAQWCRCRVLSERSFV